ncbi:serine/threonine protein kinase [Myxococcus sp. K15C18031901]|uniref:serine/threonine-protein kinase n=1 Tax=Myxococcus dinghuensis TaxID=2906761 RepID=UPI0020A744FE|nr:serine/threonine-protein kinase [Myxococcus dinghuensis]MCP3100183.1 serine/threonine protein kinase [Myxococcus dinghuensis]
MLHLALAGAFLVLAVVHFATWAAVRSQRVQLWLATSFLGFAALSFSVGVSSREASGVFADTRPWLVLGALTSIPLPYTLLRVLWALLDLPLTRWRKVLLGVTVALGAMRIVDILVSVLSARQGPQVTAEELTRATVGLGLPMFWLLAVGVVGTWAAEAARLLKRRGAMAAAVLVAALCALVVLGRELAVDTGWISGPPLFAMMGLPFLLLASTALAILTARSLRGADLGTGIHRYRRLARLGRGGMGEVWLAVRTGRAGFHRLVVLKRMVDEDSEDPAVRLHRFIGEARTAARLHHPNVVSVHDLGQVDGAWFIVMEYLSGVNTLKLSRRLRRGGAVPLEVALEACMQALRGLAYAHERGVIHRDISSDNLVVTFDGVVKVVDFGIAHGVGRPQEPMAATASVPTVSRLTQDGAVIGKMAYMPPERQEGADATVSGDLYALGCVLHELLFGELPGDAQASRHAAEWEGPQASPTQRRLREVLNTALHAEPAKRYADARAFEQALATVRKALPDVELGSWLRVNFEEQWARERALAQLEDPTLEEVQALLSGEMTPAQLAKTELMAKPREGAAEEQATRLMNRGR